MAEQSTMMPLWLDIKTEYIDENFENVVKYLHTGCVNPHMQDSFFTKTADLLEKRVSIILDELQARHIFTGYEDEGKRIVHIRMLALYLLSKGANASLWDRAFVGMLSLLQGLVPNNEQKLTEMALDCIVGRFSKRLPFSWDAIINFQPQVFAHRLCNAKMSSAETSALGSYENKGTAIVKDGVLSIAAMQSEQVGLKQVVTSIDVLDGKIQVLSEKGEKVKKSHLDNLEKLEEFTDGFIRSQRNVSRRIKTKKTYSTGDILRVYVVSKSNGEIFVRSISKEYEQIEGPIVFKGSFLYYDKNDFLKNLKVGDIIEVKLIDGVKPQFSIKESFMQYIVEERANPQVPVLAYLREVKTNKHGKKRAYFWTEDGYPAQSPLIGDYKEGDFVNVKIDHFADDPEYYGVIFVNIRNLVTDEGFDEEESRHNCIASFVYGQYNPEESVQNEESLHPGMLKELCRMLVSYQKTLPQPSERYRILCVAKILSELNPNSADYSYIDFISNYLEGLVFFAKGEISKIKDPVPSKDFEDIEAVRRRMEIVRILKAYDEMTLNDFLGGYILSARDPFLKKLATLTLSCNQISNVISKSMQNVMKREIIKMLAIDIEGDTDLEEENGMYLGIENDQNEFKTSFMFAPANAKEQNQKMTIFKGVCAFLNSKTGGTLYIGVNDIGYVSGIDADIQQMEKIQCGNYKGLDGFVRYITDEAKKHFPLDMLTHIKIQPMYEGKVMAITVQPYPFKIVKLEDTAYIRINSESVVLSDEAARNIMANRIVSNRENAYLVSALMEAINSRRKVIIHGYSSSNSGEIRDRHVEPYAFASGHTTVWCYDLDKKDNRIFKVDRMSNVEILDEEWTCTSKHKAAKMDIFRMTGDRPIKVSLQLNLLAKNVLVEEYPEAESIIIATDDSDRWLLNTDVYQMEGVCRFYVGLANCIEILDAPELEAYVKQYIKDNF